MYCQQWLRCHQAISPIAHTPSNIFIRKILNFTLHLLTNTQRAQIIRNLSPENLSQSETLLRLDWAVNGERSSLKQCAELFIDQIKECCAKLNPSSEPVPHDECVDLVSE